MDLSVFFLGRFKGFTRKVLGDRGVDELLMCKTMAVRLMMAV